MSTTWKQYEEQTVDEGWVLGEYLGGTESSGVFQAAGSAQSAIKLIRAESRDAAAQLAAWELIAQLSHPNLMQLERWGRCHVGGASMLYVVTERADEVLGEVLRERALSVEETRQMLEPVIDVLTYLHANGFVHGRIKPSNIFSVNEQLKLSSDAIRAAVSGPAPGAADVASLGETIVAALTPPESGIVPALPDPFHQIVDRCLRGNPAERWTVAQIRECLRGKTPRGFGRRYALPIATASALVFACLWYWPGFGPSHPPPPAQANQETPVAPVSKQRDDRPSPMPPRADPEFGGASPGALQSARAVPTSTAASLPEEVLRPMLPEVPEKALRTVTGRFSVSVRVQVDAGGNVTSARLESPGPSRYFADLAVDAARQWRFSAGEGERRRVIRFEFSPAGSQVIAVQ